MRQNALVVALLVAGCSASQHGPLPVSPPSGPRAGLFISPMGEPFRSSPGTDLIGTWFAGADANRDASLTSTEMEADAARFFRVLDRNGDGEVTPPEMVRYESEIAPEIQLGNQLGRAGGRGPGRGGPDGGRTGMPDGATGPSAVERGETGGRDERQRERLPEGASRYALLDLPQPVAAADADVNRAVTAVEFQAAAVERFALLDRNRDGVITRQELEPLPPPPKK